MARNGESRFLCPFIPQGQLGLTWTRPVEGRARLREDDLEVRRCGSATVALPQDLDLRGLVVGDLDVVMEGGVGGGHGSS